MTDNKEQGVLIQVLNDLSNSLSKGTGDGWQEGVLQSITKLDEFIEGVPDDLEVSLNIMYEVLRVQPYERMRDIHTAAKQLSKAVEE